MTQKLFHDYGSEWVERAKQITNWEKHDRKLEMEVRQAYGCGWKLADDNFPKLPCVCRYELLCYVSFRFKTACHKHHCRLNSLPHSVAAWPPLRLPHYSSKCWYWGEPSAAKLHLASASPPRRPSPLSHLSRARCEAARDAQQPLMAVIKGNLTTKAALLHSSMFPARLNTDLVEARCWTLASHRNLDLFRSVSASPDANYLTHWPRPKNVAPLCLVVDLMRFYWTLKFPW